MGYISTFKGRQKFQDFEGFTWKSNLYLGLVGLGYSVKESCEYVETLPNDYKKAQREAAIGGFNFGVLK